VEDNKELTGVAAIYIYILGLSDFKTSIIKL
jgi:hypothetical protein